MRLIKSIGCNIKANLQQNCNEFGNDNAKSSISVHGSNSSQPSIIHGYARWCMKTKIHSGRVATIIE